MMGLTLHQPYASLIACGAKKVETRSWARAYRGPIAIHAAKRWGMEEQDNSSTFRVAFGLALAPPLPLGAVVAVARLVNCRLMDEDWIEEQTDQELALGGWEEGRYGWVLEDVRPLVDPFGIKGHQGLWKLSPDEVEEIEMRMEARP